MTKLSEMSATIEQLEKRHSDFERMMTEATRLQNKMDREFAVHQEYTRNMLDKIFGQTEKISTKVEENTTKISEHDTALNSLDEWREQNKRDSAEINKIIGIFKDWKSRLAGVWIAIVIGSTAIGTIVGIVVSYFKH